MRADEKSIVTRVTDTAANPLILKHDDDRGRNVVATATSSDFSPSLAHCTTERSHDCDGNNADAVEIKLSCPSSFHKRINTGKLRTIAEKVDTYLLYCILSQF